MTFQKYITLGIITMFWILIPHIFLFAGRPAIEKTSVQELTEIKEPTILNLTFIFVNWFAFYFRLVTFSLPNVTAVVKVSLLAMVVMTGLSFISVFNKD